MKRLWVYIFVTICLVGLAACSPAQSDKMSCSENGEVCLNISADEKILFNEPFVVTIRVTVQKDIPELTIYLFSSPKISIETEKGWENNGVNWVINSVAGQTYTYSHKVLLPAEDAYFQILVQAYTPQILVTEDIYIMQTRDKVKVYLPGVKIPTWEGPLPTISESMKATVAALPSLTPWTTLTPAPATPEPSPLDASGTPAYPYP